MIGDPLINSFLFLAFALDLFIAILILFKSSRKENDFAFALSALSVGLWTFGILMFRVTNNLTLAWFWNREFIFTSGLIASTFLHFSIYLTGKRLNTSQKILLHLPNAFILAAVFIPNAFIRDIVIRPWGKESMLGYLYPLFGFYFSVYVIYALYRIFRALQPALGLARTQLIYIFLATLLTSIVGTYFNLYLILLGDYKYIWVGPYNSLFLTAVIAYAITKHRLMNISVIISRTVSYFIIFGFYLGGYATTAFLLDYLRPGIVYQLLFGAFAVTFAGLTFRSVRLHIQTAADKTFVKGWYDYRQVLRKVSFGLSRALTREEIVRVVYPIFLDDIDVSKVKVYFHDNKSGKYIEWDAKGEPISASFLPKDNPILTSMFSGKSMASVDRHLYVPSFVGGEMVAVFVLGKKRSEDDYTNDDLELFSTISEYVAIALEYIAKPYEEVKVKFIDAERKLFEAEKQLERSQRLASLGTLAAGVAHEIRNPLSVIRTEAEVLTKQPRNINELADFRDILARQVNRIDLIIRGMLNLSKAEKRPMADLDINEVINSTLQFFPISGIKLVKNLKPAPKLTGDPEELKQVFINLIDNAIKAMPEMKGALEIATDYDKNEDRVIAVVSDTGEGISDENMNKIYEPFFSTRHEGAGLGLSIVHRIVSEHNGTIEIKSKKGEGTTVTLKFPAKA